MGQIQALGLFKETVTPILMLYRRTKVKVCSLDGDRVFSILLLEFCKEIHYLFIICQDYTLNVDRSNKRKYLHMDDRDGWKERESYGNLCWQCDLMMLINIYSFMNI